jgi:hypothetical protein
MLTFTYNLRNFAGQQSMMRGGNMMMRGAEGMRFQMPGGGGNNRRGGF